MLCAWRWGRPSTAALHRRVREPWHLQAVGVLGVLQASVPAGVQLRVASGDTASHSAPAREPGIPDHQLAPSITFHLHVRPLCLCDIPCWARSGHMVVGDEIVVLLGLGIN
jgi:hypothetical protein